MTPAEVKATYRQFLDEVGETVSLRRYTGAGASRPSFDATVKARVTEFAPHELVGGITQGDRKLIVLAQDLFDAQWPAPPKKGDKAIVRGRELNIEGVDDNTRRVSGVLAAYEIVVRG